MVGLLDLDAFKSVNDQHGHATGDRYLVAAADRLVEALDTDGTVYRLSGDEFLIIWTSAPPEPLLSAGRILAALGQPLTIDDHTFRPAASLGLALPGPDLTGTDLIGAADQAMYVAKQHPDRSPGARSAAGLYTGTRPTASTDRRNTRTRPPTPARRSPENNPRPEDLASAIRPGTQHITTGRRANHFETVGDVMEALSKYDPASPVMSALQPGYPMTGPIVDIVQTDSGVTWIATDPVEYLPADTRDALGW